MTNRIFTCVFVAKNSNGAEALERLKNAKQASLAKKASLKLGIYESRRLIHEEPYTVEMEFRLTGATALAYSKSRKNSFERWIDDFDEKLKSFDKAEGVGNGVDYYLIWEDKTL